MINIYKLIEKNNEITNELFDTWDNGKFKKSSKIMTYNEVVNRYNGSYYFTTDTDLAKKNNSKVIIKKSEITKGINVDVEPDHGSTPSVYDKKTKNKPGLVKRKVTVKRGGKTFQRYQWVKSGEDVPDSKGGKKIDVPGSKGTKSEFNIGDKINFIGEDLSIENVSESQKTIKLSDGKVYTLDAIKYESRMGKKPTLKNLKVKKERDKEIKSDLINIKELSKQMELYKSGIKFHPDGSDMITAISDYSDTNYVAINFYLRNEKSGNKDIDKDVEHISNFLRYSPKVNGTVYRGMSFNDEKSYNEFLHEITTNKSVMMKSFTSTSTDESVISEFSKGSYPILLEIKSKNGVYLDGLAEVPEENEVLFDRKSKFKILKVDKSSSNSVKVIMEEI